MPLSRRVARFQRKMRNPVTLWIGRKGPGYAVVKHKGRKSGRDYETIVNVFRKDNQIRIGIGYGLESDWVKNVLAAGEFDLVSRGKTYHIVNLEVVNDPSGKWAPAPVALLTRLTKAPDYLQAEIASA